MVFRGGAFERSIGHGGGTLGNGTRPLSEEDRKQPDFCVCPVRTEREVGDLQPRGGPSPACDHAAALGSDFWLPELWDIHFCC